MVTKLKFNQIIPLNVKNGLKNEVTIGEFFHIPYLPSICKYQN